MERDAPSPSELDADLSTGRQRSRGSSPDAREWVRRFREMVSGQRLRRVPTCGGPYPLQAIGRWASSSSSSSSLPGRWRVALIAGGNGGDEGLGTIECPGPVGQLSYEAVVRSLHTLVASMSLVVRAMYYHDEGFAASVLLTPSTLRYAKGQFRLVVEPPHGWIPLNSGGSAGMGKPLRWRPVASAPTLGKTQSIVGKSSLLSHSKRNGTVKFSQDP